MNKEFAIGAYEKAFPEKLSIDKMFSLAKEAGYDFFELSIDRTEKRIGRVYDLDFTDSLKQVIKKQNFPVGSICLSALSTYTLGNSDKVILEKAIDIFKHTVVFASNIGARIVQIPAYDMPKFDKRNDDTDKLFFTNIAKAVEFASMYGIVLGLENMENDYMDKVSKCMRLINYINSPYLQLYPDSGNIMSANLDEKSYHQDMKTGVGHYIAFHLKETRPEKYGGLFYGEGHVDFPLLTKYAIELGVRRFVLEYWYTGNSLWKEDLIKARELCEKWAKEALMAKSRLSEMR